jgi:molybdopterin molybdotransferase
MAKTFQSGRGGERMLPVEEAQERVLAEIVTLPAEDVALEDALGRVLREDIVATADVPERANSAMDGYAIRADDVANAPVSLRVIDDLPAGRVTSTRVAPGTAIRIMTGALLPDGADAVAQVEITDAGSDVVEIREAVALGANVRPRGEDMRAGDVVLRAGSVIGPAEIGVLASVQRSVVRAGRRPEVAILATGDEIIEIDEPRASGKVVNSNSYALAAMVRQSGTIPRRLGVARDTRDATIAALRSALESDFVISTGGVSVGAFDFVKDALDALGAETKFWKVAMRPGKPVVLSRAGDRVCFGLPGNPVSCLVAFLLFVAPALRKAMGQTSNLFPPVVPMRTANRLTSKGERRAYLRVRVVAETGALVAHPMPAQGSGVSTSMLQANGLAILDTGVTSADAGSIVPVVVFAPIFTELPA